LQANKANLHARALRSASACTAQAPLHYALRTTHCTLHAVRALCMHHCTTHCTLHAVRALRMHHCTYCAHHCAHCVHCAVRSAARRRAIILQHPWTARHPELSGAQHTQRAKQPLLTLVSYLSSSRRREQTRLVREQRDNKPRCGNERGRHSIVRACTHMCVCQGVSRTCVCARACQARSCFSNQECQPCERQRCTGIVKKQKDDKSIHERKKGVRTHDHMQPPTLRDE
jgi:hypothetical protein